MWVSQFSHSGMTNIYFTFKCASFCESIKVKIQCIVFYTFLIYPYLGWYDYFYLIYNYESNLTSNVVTAFATEWLCKFDLKIFDIFNYLINCKANRKINVFCINDVT